MKYGLVVLVQHQVPVFLESQDRPAVTGCPPHVQWTENGLRPPDAVSHPDVSSSCVDVVAVALGLIRPGQKVTGVARIPAPVSRPTRCSRSSPDRLTARGMGQETFTGTAPGHEQ